MTAAGYLHHLARLSDLARQRRAHGFRRPPRRRPAKLTLAPSPLSTAPSS